MARVPSGKLLIREATQHLTRLLGDVVPRVHAQASTSDSEVDLLVEAGGALFAVELKPSSDVSAVDRALDRLERYRSRRPRVVPLVVTPFMGPSGRNLCAARGFGWFDLSGNADIRAPGIRILIDGKPNDFTRPGRPSSTFAPKSSRIARWLLMHGDAGWSQRQLTEAVRLDKGYVSRTLKRLREDGLVRLDGDKYVVDNRSLLLKAWQARYEFSKHEVIQGVMPTRSGEEATRRIASSLAPDEYAATGLSGAWALDHFASYRTASVYLKRAPDDDWLGSLSFRAVESGANVWLIVPNDEGVFDGASESDGLTCAHWVQIYLDLADHPERSKEAAEHLLETHRNWSDS